MTQPPTTQEENARETVTPLAGMLAPVVEEMGQVEETLTRELRSRHPAVDELVRYGCMLGGKRLRPALLLLAGKAAGELTEDHITLAAVVEMIHTATLVHDDLLDEAATRRHLATVHTRWGNKSGVLLGDYLFTHAFFLASGTGSTTACRVIGRATNIVCEGELRQIASRGDYLLEEEDYLQIIQAKTAELTACSCRLGALFSQASEETVERMASYGNDLGMAFQITDDLLDLVGEEETTGKSLGTDLDQQKATLPLIHLVQSLPAGERQELTEALGNGELSQAELLDRLESSGSLAYARRRAGDFAHRAIAALEELSPSPAQTVLAVLPEFVLGRAS